MASEALDLSAIPEDLMARSLLAWSTSERVPARDLLRLDALRGMARAVHAERSRCLATERRSQALALKAWEHRFEELRTAGPYEGTLDHVLTQKFLGAGTAAKPTQGALSNELLRTLGPDKLKRYDRQWEAALSAEALKLGWEFWTLDCWVDIPQAEAWNSHFSAELRPGGVVLYVETGPGAPKGPTPSRTGSPVPLPLWLGRWTTTLEPQFNNREGLMKRARNWPGYPPSSPSEPAWTLIYGAEPPGDRKS